MAKHKIVKFENGRARVLIVQDFAKYLPLEDNKTLFINPDLKYVRGVSPEFWTVKDGVLWPLEGEELDYRRKVLEVQHAASNRTNEDVIDDLLIQIGDIKFDLKEEINSSNIVNQTQHNELDSKISKQLQQVELHFDNKLKEQHSKYIKFNVLLTAISIAIGGLIYLIK